MGEPSVVESSTDTGEKYIIPGRKGRQSISRCIDLTTGKTVEPQ